MSVDRRTDAGEFYPGGKIISTRPVATGGDIKHSDFKDLDVKTNTLPDLREAVRELGRRLGATVLTSLVVCVALGASVQTVPINDLDLDTNPSVVTNVTFDPAPDFSTGNTQLVATIEATAPTNDFVRKTGDTMTGPLIIENSDDILDIHQDNIYFSGRTGVNYIYWPDNIYGSGDIRYGDLHYRGAFDIFATREWADYWAHAVVSTDVPAWALAAQKPTYTAGEVGAVPTTGGDMTGGLTVPNLTVGSRKDGSTVGRNSVAEGEDTTASATYAHAEGGNTVASGIASHAEGSNTTASGTVSHAEGYFTKALGRYTHAEGTDTIATNDYEHAQGRSNASHKASDTFGDAGNTLSSIGFSDDPQNRKNAVETMQDGKTFIYGLGGYDGTNPTGTGVQDLATAINSKASDSDIPPAVLNIVTTAYVRERLGVWMEYDEATGFYYYCHEEE